MDGAVQWLNKWGLLCPKAELGPTLFLSVTVIN